LKQVFHGKEGRYTSESAAFVRQESYHLNCGNAIPSIWNNPTMTCADGNVGV
jgi:hypothetical protein